MAHKGNHYEIKGALDFIGKLKDFMVACGWQLVGPTDTEPNRIAQDDKHAHILGWFLNSNGEDGSKDQHVHLHWGEGPSSRLPGGLTTWLTAGITASQTDAIPLHDATDLAAGDVVQIDGEGIQVGSVDTSGTGGAGDPHYLNGCVRGYGTTDPATHDAGDTVARVIDNGGESAYPYIRQYVYRDLANAVGVSDPTVTWSLGEKSNADPITGLIYPSGRAWDNGLGLLKVADSGSSHDGQMRWIKTDDGAGRYTWVKFKTSAPGVGVGSYKCEIISGGWMPGISNNQLVGSSSQLKTPVMSGGPSGIPLVQTDAWFYGNKDGVAVVFKAGTTYRAWYFGDYVPFANPASTTATAVGGGDIAAGVLSIDVADRNLFVVGGKYRIVSQDYRDWTDNWDRSADTAMGASPGDWADLEGDETAQEYLVVNTITPGAGDAGTITFDHPLIYSYRAGAVVGEDPRRFVGFHCYGSGSSHSNQFESSSTIAGAHTPLHAVSKSRFRVDRPAHRRHDRCTYSGTTWNPWQGNGGFDYRGGHIISVRTFMEPFDPDVLDNDENYVDKLVVVPMSIGWYDGTDRTGYGGFWQYLGIIPILRQMYSNLGGTSEDTVKIPWDGKQETARIFYEQGSSKWLCAGPEIWP